MKLNLFAGVLAASLALPALANEGALVAPVPEFTAADTQQLFEQDARPMQLAALSADEMRETEGAFWNFAIGGGLGLGMYTAQSWFFNQPMTWRGAGVAVAAGALTGGVGSALVRASGGGIAGKVAWLPNQWAANYSLNRVFGGRR